MAGQELTEDLIRNAKRLGFSDKQIALGTGSTAEKVRAVRYKHNIRPVYKMVDTCAAEFEAVTPYYYSTYREENEAISLPGPQAVILILVRDYTSSHWMTNLLWIFLKMRETVMSVLQS